MLFVICYAGFTLEFCNYELNVPLETKLWHILANRDLNVYLILQILYHSKSETTGAMKKY